MNAKLHMSFCLPQMSSGSLLFLRGGTFKDTNIVAVPIGNPLEVTGSQMAIP